MSTLTNKIDANNRTVHEVLDGKKYEIDYFQREFSWGQTHIDQLVTDLTSAFLEEYSEGDSRQQGQSYNNYYMGPIVFIERQSGRSIIDGQQRLTSLTLFLTYLNHLQKEINLSERLESMIYSEHRGSRSFNLQFPERQHCFEALFSDGTYEPTDQDDESTVNMVRRYDDIVQAFPDELRDARLAHFLDWLRHNVILVEIVAYSDENAYTIFETMNDRGLNLTSTEMLKGYILSNIEDPIRRSAANDQWREAIQRLHRWAKDEDQRFFQAWLRSQYAETIRLSAAGAQNEDFEKIGTRFHRWVRDNLSKLGLRDGYSNALEGFLAVDFPYYLNAYVTILQAQNALTSGLEHAYYIQRWGIASSLSFPLMIAPLTVHDDTDTANRKIDVVARFIESFVVRRSINYRRFSASSIRYTMYTLVKEIRSMELDDLESTLRDRLDEIAEPWSGFKDFGLHGQNKRFVKFLLARITSFVEVKSGMNSSFCKYYDELNGKPFEIEHIWADRFEDHRVDFEQRDEFQQYRNLIGGLILIPQGTNQSLGTMSYEDKRKHYVGENLLAKSLCEITYENNPNFTNMFKDLSLNFCAYNVFDKNNLLERQHLYQEICEKIWSFEERAD